MDSYNELMEVDDPESAVFSLAEDPPPPPLVEEVVVVVVVVALLLAALVDMACRR